MTIGPAGEVTIVPVHGESAMSAFVRFPWHVQGNDPYWVPPILSEQERFLDPGKGPFFEFGEAQYFLAFEGGQAVGRISAHLNRRHEELHDAQTGFFGFFESVNSQKVAAALFDAAAEWLRVRGKSRIVGPLSFGIYDEVGFLVEGFDSLPAILQSHNPPYYEDLAAGWGLRKAIDWYAFKVTDRMIDAASMEEKLARIMKGNGLVLTSPKPRDFARRADDVFEIFNESWGENWGHVPFTRRQFDEIFRQLKPLMRADLIRMIMDGGRMVAFIINIPDLNPSIQKLNGRLSFLDKAKLYYEAKFKPIHKVRTLLMGVRREYQLKRLHHALILSTYIHIVRKTTCVMCDCSLVAETTRHLLRDLKAYGTERYKTFRIFEREI